MIYPLVRELACDGIPVKVTCRVLGFSPQGFYKWRAHPVSVRDWSDAHLVDAARQIHDDDSHRPPVRRHPDRRAQGRFLPDPEDD